MASSSTCSRTIARAPAVPTTGTRSTRHPFDVSHFQGAAVLLVNSNFGCGSSREHAPQALQRWGIQVVIGESFSGIFFDNSGMIGMPCVTAAPQDVAALMDLVEREPATEFVVDLVAGTCRAGALAVKVALPPKMLEAFVSGAWDTTGMLLDRFDDVRETAKRLPYASP
jgi:3-isopropylmalate/(R)-2-methylmalate dehydratase small subunit